ncbi:probable DNA-directed RNA polymerase I subunit RPA43 [Anopheles maculipalpis]|uniref:probable DNA-directed RNA polymerase I subunit RPA43 n=1 Tax=Anopheles maculipalpis TaxID=1496333 RepID=UPI0021595D8B|nr:probable DNA-directed RNA polymerase I subunit RPA43 [Anopheles maculipalpis]
MHRTTIAKYTKFSADELHKSLSDPLSCVVAVQLNEILSLRPRDCEHIIKGVRRCVTDKIGRYHAKVNGIVLGYAKIRIDNALSALRLDSPYLHVRATIDYYVFQPRIGSTLRGTVNYVSKEFVSAMIYRVFNVTVKLGKNVNQQQTVKKGSDITFNVKSCDMKSELPVIEGELVLNEIPALKIKQEPDSDKEEAPDNTSKAKKSKKLKEPAKEKTIKKAGVPLVQPVDATDTSEEGSDDSTDEKSLLIKSLINKMFGDPLTNGDSSEKEKRQKKKTPKKTIPAKEASSPVVVKQEPLSTDEEESVDSGHSTSQSNDTTTVPTTKSASNSGTVEKRRKKIRFDPNDTVTYIKSEPTESRKKKRSVTE